MSSSESTVVVLVLVGGAGGLRIVVGASAGLSAWCLLCLCL